MFKIMFDHAKSLEEFYWYALFYISDLKAMPEMKNRARLTGDRKLLQVYEKLERVLEKRNVEEHGNWKVVLDDTEQLEQISRVYHQYIEVTQESIKLLGSHIRQNPYEYIQ
ncbi:hypothetical protein [Paenibacillus senegalensis]|uniref:hypothetical protein n=1 Tax=Paenibacillus senegalensis TaxID=1465766 RepID=UPI000289620B|nr:hypothetical protein [Paenibacillus senegalensis]